MHGSKWIGTSWKMNKTLAEANAFVDGLLSDEANSDTNIQRFVIPPFTCVREVASKLFSTNVKVGAQNMHWLDEGACTGEVSPLMLTDCGLDIVELGHSERRASFGETNKTVGLKVEAAVRHGLMPLICIGEKLEDKQSGRASEVLEIEVRAALRKLSESQLSAPILLAYEPVWAIGENGIPASSQYADARQAEIKAVAKEMLGADTPCLYGGSVNQDNCEELINCTHIDGLFIGRSAWSVEGYIEILNRCANALKK